MTTDHGSARLDAEESAISRHLERARAILDRLTPERAFAEVRDGALLVDTRTFEQRRVQGDVPDALRIDRTVFEWRLDPTGPWCIPEVSSADARIIVMCRQGFSSSLAAASLQAIGLTRATDIVGGFEAWHDAGLPVTPFVDPVTPTDLVAGGHHPAGGSVSGSG
ncbi:MAG: rhodanese-like domain-containing protein [Actinomycetota bacterium]